MEYLPADQVHVWCAHPEALATGPAYAAAKALLAPEEIERLERFVFARDRQIFLATRALVRQVLSRYATVAPEGWRFVINDHGRPEIQSEGDPPVSFNLSNTYGLVVCAVCRQGEIGVDVEPVDRAPAYLELADRYFAPIEVAALRALPLHAQPRRFCEYWTLKESYLKARGLGLALPLDRFAFILDPGHPPRLEVDSALDESGDSWKFTLRRPTANHVLAVCVRPCRPGEVTLVLRWQLLDPCSRSS